METHLQQESDTSNEQIRSLEENVRSEKQRREDAEQELLKQKQVHVLLVLVMGIKIRIDNITNHLMLIKYYWNLMYSDLSDIFFFLMILWKDIYFIKHICCFSLNWPFMSYLSQ